MVQVIMLHRVYILFVLSKEATVNNGGKKNNRLIGVFTKLMRQNCIDGSLESMFV